MAQAMAPQESPVTPDETCPGRLCLVAMEPVRNAILLEPRAEARAQDPWSALMAPPLAPRKGNVLPATREEALGLLAYVEPHLGAHPSADLFHGHHELSQAVAVPMAAKQRAAPKAVTQAAETLHRGQEPLDTPNDQPANRPAPPRPWPRLPLGRLGARRPS